MYSFIHDLLVTVGPDRDRQLQLMRDAIQARWQAVLKGLRGSGQKN